MLLLIIDINIVCYNIIILLVILLFKKFLSTNIKLIQWISKFFGRKLPVSNWRHFKSIIGSIIIFKICESSIQFILFS